MIKKTKLISHPFLRRGLGRLLFGILLCLPFSGMAQVSPVSVTTMLTPPYSLTLSDYTRMGAQNMVVTIMVNDVSITNLPVRLHLKIETTAGITIENTPMMTTTPIYLSGGQVSVLFGEDLADYFNVNNLQFKGYSREEYRRTGQLPEGFYRFSVEVRHFDTGRVISRQGTAMAWIALGKPPLLKSPMEGAEMGQINGMPLTFSWQPSALGVPNAGLQYTFEMWEMRMPGISPYVVAASMPVFHSVSQQGTTLTILPASLFLEPGMQYAWRVTASDPAGLIPFAEKGQSEIRTFVYQSKCDCVTDFTIDRRGRDATVSWRGASNQTSFYVEVENPDTDYSNRQQVFNNSFDLHGLQTGSTYNIRVQAVCNSNEDNSSDYTAWSSLNILEAKPLETDCPDCGCDVQFTESKITNFKLRKDLQPGDTIVTADGGTRFILETVEQQSDGVYKGIFLYWWEYYRVKILCEYWDLSVNTDNVIVDFDFESVYDPQFLLDVDNTQEYIGNLADAIATLTPETTIKDSIKIDEPIADIYVDENGNVVVETLQIESETEKEAIVNDIEEKSVIIAFDSIQANESFVENVNSEQSNDTIINTPIIPKVEEVIEEKNLLNDSDFELQLFKNNKIIKKDSIIFISQEPKMPEITVKVVSLNEQITNDSKIEVRLDIEYQRDGIDAKGNTIVNVRQDRWSTYALEWKSLSMNEEWIIDFGEDIRGGSAYLQYKHNEKIDTIRFYIRGVNPTEAQIKQYMNQRGYISSYWFLVKMTRQESSFRQYGSGTKYQKTKLTGNSNASGEPLYGYPRGFGLKQLDNWGNGQYATAQHLWNWKANIDGGIEVIKEKKELVDKAKENHIRVIEDWNSANPDNLVSDTLKIIAGEGSGTYVLTITEGSETFSVSPTINERDIYDARWIKLFNGGSPYYQVNGGVGTKPRRELNRSNNVNKNYVKDVCGRAE
ncbi:fibronectin type III domain-containing protein [Paludibacter sp. 221]|uniref:fibronectin type III domain-containing protein n=1 Tax=Paludibacter sp. 221 TaxID=2302939 RepID=UPI0013D0CF7C|nr:fibronectin type III domain-containing protein [Paludibacter sp. 221]